VACRPGFLLPVRVLSRLFRRLDTGPANGRKRRNLAIGERIGDRPDLPPKRTLGDRKHGFSGMLEFSQLN